MKRLSLAMAYIVATLAGCATTTTAPAGPPSPCASDLMQGGYVSGKRAQSSAETYCSEYSISELSIGKDLYDKRYVASLGDGLAFAAHYQPAEIACAKRELDAARTDNPTPALTMSDACAGTTFQAPVETAVAEPAPKSNTLFDVLSNEGHCSRFLAAVDKVGLTQSLKTGGPWTVLAPTNRALRNYPGGFDELMDKPERLKKFVRMHLVDGVHPSGDVKPGGAKWPTADGRSVVVVKKGAVTFNKDVKAIKADIPADNGLVYTINDALVP